MTAQDRRMRQVLARLELVSHGSTASWNVSGGGDMRQRDFGRPPGEQYPPHEEYREKYRRAVTDTAREQVIRDAQAKLKEITRRRDWTGGTHTDEEILRDRILKEGRGRPALEVAQSLRCLERMVRRVRRDEGRDEDLDDGPVKPTQAVDVRSWEHARELHAKGMTLRQIEQITGLKRSTLHRNLRRAA